MDKFYITTTLPYVNSDPHVGFALEIIQADAIARYHASLGQEVFFNTGTDEHGLKIYQKATEQGKDVQTYCDEYAEKFKTLIPALGISPDVHFIRTTDAHHVAACQEFWKIVDKNGYIYKAKYKVKYCVGCELEKTESDLDESGRCPLHPHLELELRDEENYFFKFSEFQKPLLELYGKYPDFVVPDFRFNEIKEFVKRGLADFSISRLKDKMPWGVPVPGDEDHVMYVWFDALINYISTLGWPNGKFEIRNTKSERESSSSLFEEYWGTKDNPRAIQIAGKDNLRQQSAMWQAMLLAADLPTSRRIIIHGFITSGGQKMSKSLGNVADPYSIIRDLEGKGLSNEQAVDALRYYLLREIPTFEDGDYTWEHFVETYNSGLANGLGNLTSRILTMATQNSVAYNFDELQREAKTDDEAEKYTQWMENYQLRETMESTWRRIKECDVYIQDRQPFKTIKTDRENAEKDIHGLLVALCMIAGRLRPFMPRTAEKILVALRQPDPENIPRLFPRIQ